MLANALLLLASSLLLLPHIHFLLNQFSNQCIIHSRYNKFYRQLEQTNAIPQPFDLLEESIPPTTHWQSTLQAPEVACITEATQMNYLLAHNDLPNKAGRYIALIIRGKHLFRTIQTVQFPYQIESEGWTQRRQRRTEKKSELFPALKGTERDPDLKILTR